MKILKKVLKILIIIFLTIIITVNVYNFINVQILNKKMPIIFGYSALEVVSGSMEPTIKTGDIIIIDTKATNFKPSDIVTFYDENGSFVTHRIISINGDEMVTKGDYNESLDGITKTNKIVGRYVIKIPFLGMLFDSFKNPIILLFILIIGILFCYLISMDENKENNISK